jgi:hypothetical protein
MIIIIIMIVIFYGIIKSKVTRQEKYDKENPNPL